MELLLTIIIPSYNIENYIEKCLSSFEWIKKENKEKIEILVVNDGSTDNTKEVIDNYIKKSELSISLINKANGGHGSTINVGIEKAKGKYFKIIDGDDWVNAKELDKLIAFLEDKDVDLIVCDYTEQHCYNNTTVKKSFKYPINKILPVEEIKERVSIHGIIYNTNLLKDNNIVITENAFYVDIEYTLYPLIYVKNFIYFDLDIYQYYLGRADQSVSLNSFLKNINQHFRIIKNVISFKERKLIDLSVHKNVVKIIEDSLNELIGRQMILSNLHPDKEVKIDELNTMLKNSSTSYKYEFRLKLSSLLYLNYNTKFRFKYILNPLINFKLNQIIKQKRLH